MAEMRLPAQASVLLAGLLLLTLPALASAEPKPVPRPKTITPIKKTSTPPANSTPVQSTPPPAPPSPPSPPADTSKSSTRGTGSTTINKAPVDEPVIVVTALGGRDQSGIAVPAPPPPEPTPLSLVAAGERVTSPGTSTPPWKIALLALLAAAEAFLVVSIIRNRPSGDLSPAS
jgi:hypothetical protein